MFHLLMKGILKLMLHVFGCDDGLKEDLEELDAELSDWKEMD